MEKDINKILADIDALNQQPQEQEEVEEVIEEEYVEDEEPIAMTSIDDVMANIDATNKMIASKYQKLIKDIDNEEKKNSYHLPKPIVITTPSISNSDLSNLINISLKKAQKAKLNKENAQINLINAQQQEAWIKQRRNSWKELKKNFYIANYITIELISKFENCINNLKYYIQKAKEAEKNGDLYFYLKYNEAKMLGDSLCINILPICEMLDINVYSWKKSRKLDKVKMASVYPLLIWYFIATYKKHSSKPYLDPTVDLAHKNWKELYEYLFDKYCEDVVISSDLTDISKDDKEIIIKEFKEVYLYWYDYLFVRLFSHSEDEKDALQKVNNGKIEKMPKEQKQFLKKYNKYRENCVYQLYMFFSFILKQLKKEKNVSYHQTTLYNLKEVIWSLFLQNFNNNDNNI